VNLRERLKSTVVQDSARIAENLVGLPDVNVLGLDDSGPVLVVHVECRRDRPGCPACGVMAHLKDQRPMGLVDLRCFGNKPTRLASH